MASTFTADEAGSDRQARWESGRTISVSSNYEITAALVIADVIQMVKIPKGATIIDMTLAADDLDTDSTPTIVLDVGDGTTTDRFIDGSTIAQAGGVLDGINEVDGLGYEYTADDTIDVIAQAAPATGATSGSIKLAVTYICNDD